MIAVIFSSQRTDYIEGYGISISYWKDQESAKSFKQVPIHIEAQNMGKSHYYEWHEVKVCSLEREHSSKGHHS